MLPINNGSARRKRFLYFQSIEVGKAVLIKICRTSDVISAMQGGFNVIGKVISKSKTRVHVQFKHRGRLIEHTFSDDLYSTEPESYGRRPMRQFWLCLPYSKYAPDWVRKAYFKNHPHPNQTNRKPQPKSSDLFDVEEGGYDSQA